MRRGFTMIELLVVISIIVVLAGLAVLITPRFAEDQRTSRGADLIQGWLLGAKQRAYRDQSPRGIRLVKSLDGDVREMVWIERPEDVRGEPDALNPAQDRNHLVVPSPVLVPPGGPPNSYVLLPGWDVATGDVVQSGDWIKISTYESDWRRISDVTRVVAGTVLRLAAQDGTPSRVLPGGNGQVIRAAGDTRFVIKRAARPMQGEPVLQLPRGVIVDLTNAAGASQVADLDVMFDERGQLFGSNGSAGKVVLRVRNEERAASGEQIFVVIWSRTGLISACPMGPVADPYQFVRSSKEGM